MLFPRLLNLAQQSRPGLLVGAETFRLTRLGPIGRVVLWMEREKNALSARQRFTHSFIDVCPHHHHHHHHHHLPSPGASCVALVWYMHGLAFQGG